MKDQMRDQMKDQTKGYNTYCTGHLSYIRRLYHRTDSPLSHRPTLPEWTHRWNQKEQKEKEQKEKEQEEQTEREQVSLDTSPSYNHSWTYTERWPRNSSKKGTHYRPVGP